MYDFLKSRVMSLKPEDYADALIAQALGKDVSVSEGGYRLEAYYYKGKLYILDFGEEK